ncbi:MAG TPA: histidine kinase [Gemmatimonadaceae bacterium]|nr:histidine kinase [Gemmatimonadaceae bacterium]
MTDPTAASDRREYYPLRPVDLAAIGLFWLFVAFLSAAGRELDPRIPGVPGAVVQSVLRAEYLEYALWALMTVPIWWLASRYSIERGRRWGRAVLFLVGGIVLAIAMDSLLSHVREALMSPLVRGGRFRRRGPPPLFGFGFLDDLMVYFAVFGSGVARDYFLRYRARLQETSRLRAQLVQARLDALRTQLNPHFLFNTLNAMSALVERDPRGVRRMIARLSDLLRYTLDESTEQEVPLERELDLLGEYVELMQIRFQGKLNVDMRIDDDVRRALVPNLILQPILENSIKHGVGQLTGEGRIALRASRAGSDLLLTVTDNGPGPADGHAAAGVGLTNTNARLSAMYGDMYRAALNRAAGGGAEAVIRIPYHVEPLDGALGA